VPGRVGQSLLDVAQMHDIELESGCGGGGAVQQKKHSERWTEDLFGRGKSESILYRWTAIPYLQIFGGNVGRRLSVDFRDTQEGELKPPLSV